jgi:aspartokinase/homoserine dehydrogenase 1
MLINESGIDLDSWEKQIQQSTTPTNLAALLNEIKQLNLGNNVFIDCTASQAVVDSYEALFAARASVVTVNKIGNTGAFAQYQKFQSTARDHNVHYLYETTAGAALPIIGTLRDLVNSGDRILKIEAILSGTISYIFNNFKPGKKFSTIVKEAKRKGYTEPDPRNDLNGMDFARKLLILAREIGKSIELEDIDLEPILPEACRKAETVQSFISELEKADPYFSDLCKKAHKKGKVLRYIALLNKNTTAIKLKAVNSTHPFYSLGGSDNIIAITTQRYRDNPLVFKGAGAGAEVTAAGVMADIFKIANSVIKKRIF